MFDWIKLVLEQWKTIMSILVLLGVSGVSIYGNVNEINPWKVVEEFINKDVYEEPSITVIEKTIETRVEAGITKESVQKLITLRWEAHIEEYH